MPKYLISTFLYKKHSITKQYSSQDFFALPGDLGS